MNERRRGDPAAVQAEAFGRRRPATATTRSRALRAAIDRVDARDPRAPERARAPRRGGRRAQARRAAASVYQAARERDLIAALEAAQPRPVPDRRDPPGVPRDRLGHLLPSRPGSASPTSGPRARSRTSPPGRPSAARRSCCPRRRSPTSSPRWSAAQADHGVVPVENTTEGVVTQTLDTFVGLGAPDLRRDGAADRPLPALAERPARGRAARRLPRRSPSPSAGAGSTGSLPRAERIEVASTVAAGGPRGARGRRRGGREPASRRSCSASPSPRRTSRTAATTRRASSSSAGRAPAPSGHDLTSVVFTVRKAEAGALHRLLAPFARHGVNLTSIQSRPLKGTPWEYLFFIDLEGHRSEPARRGRPRRGLGGGALGARARLVPARRPGAAPRRGGGR